MFDDFRGFDSEQRIDNTTSPTDCPSTTTSPTDCPPTTLETIDNVMNSAKSKDTKHVSSHINDAKSLLQLLSEKGDAFEKLQKKVLTLVAYVRKSVDDGRGNDSLADQKAVLKRWITDKNHVLHPKIFEEVASSGSQRVVFEEMLKFVNDHNNAVDGIIVYKLDRFGRSMSEVLATVDELTIKRGKNLVCVMDNILRGPHFANDGTNLPFLLNCLVGEYERENIRRRTKTAKQERKRRGIGQSRFSPYGFRFSVVDSNGIESQSFQAGTLKVARASKHDSKLAIVEHYGEQKQIDCLIAFSKGMQHSKGRLPTGGEMLVELRSKGLDDNFRNIQEDGKYSKLTNTSASNLKKNLLTYLKNVSAMDSMKV